MPMLIIWLFLLMRIKFERMAEDENYRKQYEGIIANAASGLSQLGQSIAATGANVKGYGMQVNEVEQLHFCCT